MEMEDNELITWSSKFKCGIKLIDDQHKGLIGLVNEMFNHVTGSNVQERDYFNRVIRESVKYIKIHFATEEKIMRMAKFAGYAEHKKEHDNFVLTVVGNINAYKAGKRYTLSAYTRFLKNWALSHIALIDKLDFEYIRHTAGANIDRKLHVNFHHIKAHSKENQIA